MNRTFQWLITAMVAAASILPGLSPAQDDESPAPPRATPFGVPHVFKVDWQDYLLKTGDLNHDGSQDWFTINRAKSLLSLYLSKDADPAAPFDEAFELREIVVDKFVTGAWVADVTGDGRQDILLSGKPDRIEVLIQDDQGRLLPPDERNPECQVVCVDEAAKPNPLLYAFQDNRITLYAISGHAQFEELAEYHSTAAPRGEPGWVDMDGDGIEDLVYLDATKQERIIIRRRGANGRLMPEESYDIGTDVSITDLTLAGGSALLAVDAKTRVLKMLALRPKLDASLTPATRLGSAMALGFDREGQSSKTFMELGDFNADGRQDVLLVAPEAGNMRLFYASDTIFSARKFPAYEGITKARYIAPAAKDAAPLIAVVSQSERVMAFSHCHTDNRIDFPQPAVFDIEPINFEIADVDGNKKPDFFFLGKDAEGKAHLRLYANPALPTLDHDTFVVIDLTTPTINPFATSPTVNPFVKPPTEPPSPSELPADVRVLDLNQDGRPDLALFFEFAKPRLFLQSPKGHFVPAQLNKSVEEGLVANMTAGNTFSASLPQTGQSWTFLARANFLRAFSIKKDNTPFIYRQFNGKNNRSTVERAAILRSDGGRQAAVALLDKYNKVLTLYHFDADEWKIARHLDLDDANWIDMTAGDLNGDGHDDLLLLASDRLVIYIGGQTPHELDTLLTLKSDIEDGYYALVETLELQETAGDAAGAGERGGQPAVESVALLENSEHLLEFFDVDASGETPALSRSFRFKVFSGEDDARTESGSGRFQPAEPRSVRTADINGDGRPDLLILVHDRVIAYLAK